MTISKSDEELKNRLSEAQRPENVDERIEKQKVGLTEKGKSRRKFLYLGGAVAGGAVAAYAGYRFGLIPGINPISTYDKNFVGFSPEARLEISNPVYHENWIKKEIVITDHLVNRDWIGEVSGDSIKTDNPPYSKESENYPKVYFTDEAGIDGKGYRKFNVVQSYKSRISDLLTMPMNLPKFNKFRTLDFKLEHSGNPQTIQFNFGKPPYVGTHRVQISTEKNSSSYSIDLVKSKYNILESAMQIVFSTDEEYRVINKELPSVVKLYDIRFSE